MGLLSSQLLTELSKPNPAASVAMEIDLPGGTQRYAGRHVNVAGQGTFLGKIRDQGFGALIFDASDKDNRLVQVQFQVTFIDKDLTFANVLEGSGGNSVRNSAARVKLSSHNVAYANWFTVFAGIVSSWQLARGDPISFTVTLSPKDQALRAPFPKTAIMASDFPNALATLYSSFVPIIYGTHDSTGTSGTGMVPCYCVKTSGNTQWLVAMGWLQNVNRVYSNGTLQSSNNYTVSHPLINGRRYTRVDFTSSPPASSATVTADVAGLESFGDGSGYVLQGAEALKHLLVNFVYGDWQSGTWLADATAPIDVTSFTTAQAWLRRMGIQLSSRWYGGASQTQGRVPLDEFCATKQLFPFWTNAGNLAVLPHDLTDPTIYYSGTQLIFEGAGEVLGIFEPTWDVVNVEDRINTQYVYGSAGAQHLKQLEVRNLLVSENVSEARQALWNHASVSSP